MSPVSKKRASELRRYAKLRAEFLAERPRCKVTGAPATEIHHIRGRAGALLNMQEFWLPVSRAGHDWIHLNPRKAASLGWIAKPGEWGEKRSFTEKSIDAIQ